MATIFTTGTAGNDLLNVWYDGLAGDTHVISGLAGDDVITLTGDVNLSAPPGNSVDGGADFDTLVIAEYGITADFRNWSISNIEKIRIAPMETGARFTATQLQSLGPNLIIEGNAGGGTNKLHIYADPGQDFDVNTLAFTNWPLSASPAIFSENRIIIYGGSGDETYTGSAQREEIYGGLGDDTIDGGTHYDWLYGGDGNDVIYAGAATMIQGDYLDGGAGDDVLWSNGWNTFMIGGTGADTYHVFTTNDASIVETGTDIDTVVSHMAGTWNLGGNLENLTIAAGVLGSGNGNGANNVMTGNGIGNTLDGAGGNDIIRGNNGNDKLIGGAGDDLLRGGAGKDVMNGGFGRDSMYAGLADSFTDTFVFGPPVPDGFGGYIFESGTTALTRDRIFEFVTGEDKVDLSLIDAAFSTGGNNAFTFIGSAGFTAEGQVRAVASGANTLLQFNTTGTTGAEASIMIMGVAPSALTAGDFIL